LFGLKFKFSVQGLVILTLLAVQNCLKAAFNSQETHYLSKKKKILKKHIKVLFKLILIL